MTAAVSDTRPFALFEWMLALRYLRSRRKEGFISVIAGFSFIGIMLGVATLIIVMAVMNGFRNELFSKILGLNGHVIVNKIGGNFEDYQQIADRIARVPGVRTVMPLIEGQVMVTSAVQATGGLVRGMSEGGMKGLPLVANNIRYGTHRRLREPDGHRHRHAARQPFARQRRRQHPARIPARCDNPVRQRAAHQALRCDGAVRDGDVGIRPHHDLHAARRGAALFLARARGRRARDRGRQPRPGR